MFECLTNGGIIWLCPGLSFGQQSPLCPCCDFFTINTNLWYKQSCVFKLKYCKYIKADPNCTLLIYQSTTSEMIWCKCGRFANCLMEAQWWLEVWKVSLHLLFIAHLYILYLVEKPCRFFSTKSMYSGEWWNGPLSERSQSRGPPGLSLGRPDAATVAVAPDRKHTQQWRLRLMMPHRAISDGEGEG